MNYLDFSGLLILAVSCNLVYLIYSESNIQDKDMFYRRLFEAIAPAKRILESLNLFESRSIEWNYHFVFIVNSIVENISSEKIKEIKKKPLDKEDEKIVDNKLKEFFEQDSKKAGELIKKVKKIMDIDSNINKVENEIESIKLYKKKINQFKIIDNIKYIALISFLYSFCILIIAPFYKEVNLNELLFITNIIIIIASLMYVFVDMFRMHKATIIKTSLCLIIIIFILTLFENGIIFDKYNEIIGKFNYIITIFVCFIGFIMYLIFPPILLLSYSKCFWLKRKDTEAVLYLYSLFEKHKDRIEYYITKGYTTDEKIMEFADDIPRILEHLLKSVQNE